MVPNNAVFRKSAAGQDALAHRDATLGLRLRSLLILVDGKRPVDELAKLSPGADVPALLSQLLQLGLVESAAGPATSASTAPAPAPAASATEAAAVPQADAAAPAKPLTLQEAQRAAVRCLTDLLGPDAESLCMRIEAARSPQDFQAAAKRAETMLRSVGGPKMAATFLRSVEGYRPA